MVYYRLGRDIIDWVWREDMDNKWHSEQTNHLNTFGVEVSGAYAPERGFLRRVSVAYGYTTAQGNERLVTKNAMDLMRHKAALGVEFRFLRRMTLSATGSVYDRNGSYTFYPVAGNSSQSEIRDYNPYFLLDAMLSWEKGWCRLYAEASNLTGSDYCDLGGIPLPGRWITGGVVLTFGK